MFLWGKHNCDRLLTPGPEVAKSLRNEPPDLVEDVRTYQHGDYWILLLLGGDWNMAEL
jgi:hypothetical protein